MLRLLPKPATTAPRRMDALAILPIFMSLQGRRAVLIGNSDPVVWKAELLAAAGADVSICLGDEVPIDAIESLAQSGAAAGSITLHHRNWTQADLADATIAVADIEDETEAQDFVRAARTIGIPHNVIDKPDFCSFQFGSIVNRSPVVISISTDGAAPILGQAVRRRIEAILPAFLGAWGKLAANLRSSVMEALPSAADRRLFWEDLAEKAFAGPPSGNRIDQFGTGKAQGRVTLVGAGPGDAELLTLKAVRALQSADVILYDDLVSPAVLELARREAKRVAVGKRAGRHSCGQDDINALMISLARQGRRVVRLKSGDPMIFGRAGEEIAELDQAGIAVDVVPGITSALALASRLGISLTHRDHAQSVRFVTGHCKAGTMPDNLDWRGLADDATTTIFYMSRRSLAGIVGNLVAHGLPASTPCVMATSLFGPTEKIATTTLADALDLSSSFDLEAPFLFATGNALAARQQMLVTERLPMLAEA